MSYDNEIKRFRAKVHWCGIPAHHVLYGERSNLNIPRILMPLASTLVVILALAFSAINQGLCPCEERGSSLTMPRAGIRTWPDLIEEAQVPTSVCQSLLERYDNRQLAFWKLD